MSRRLLPLALSAVFSMAAATAHADSILIGGTSLTLVYDAAAQTLCDESGCASFDNTNNLADSSSLTSLDFEIDGTPVGSLDNPPTDINADVYLTGIVIAPGGGVQFDPTITGGYINFYTDGADGFDYLQLNVTGGLVAYNGNGLFSVNVSTSNTLLAQNLTYSFGNFVFTDPDIAWAFSAASSTTTSTGFTATGTPDWQDESIQFDTPVPEPASMLLLGTGLLGSAGLARIRRRRSKK